MSQNIIIIIPFVVVIFFALREVMTWYWKLNKISNLLEKIEENTRKKVQDGDIVK
jgi:hypothetical protein